MPLLKTSISKDLALVDCLIGTVTVRGCRIDMVGGSMMLNSQETVCLGNGIDFWLHRTSSDYVIEDNYISRCYDCGCSIQSKGW